MAGFVYRHGLRGFMDLWVPQQGKVLSKVKFRKYSWAGLDALSFDPQDGLPDRYPLDLRFDGGWESLIPLVYLYPSLSAVVLRLNLGAIVYGSIAFYDCKWSGWGQSHVGFEFALTSREQPGLAAWMKVETDGPFKASESGKAVLFERGR